MKVFSKRWLMTLLMAGFLAGCGGDGGGTTGSAGGGSGGGTGGTPGGGGGPVTEQPGPDPYADSTATPPAPIVDPTITAAATIAPRDDDSGLFDINIAGFASPSSKILSARQLSMRSGPNKSAAARANLTRAGVPDLEADDFVIVEDGVVKGHTMVRIGESEARAKADVVFVFDTTGSMSSALASVQASILEFADFLEKSGLDVRLGAVTFGDAFDTRTPSSTGLGTGSTAPPSFDNIDRQVFAPTDDFAKFRQFISEEQALGGGDNAENAMGALQYAFDELPWREGAQRVIIVITDVYAHNDVTYGGANISGRWIPPAAADLIAKLKGKAVVHVVSPEFVASPGLYTDMKVFAGADGTGGAYYAWSSGTFSLIDLPIAEVAASGYIVTYRPKRDGKAKTLRVVIDDGEDIRGEINLDVEY
ncbi:VWA domain-containing protein [uncultured Pigmentiphaga sp.]|uniref:vWA domain-containing protein n=1 Tax=uncultured Pigmentiphaga sp. TaxID=340361 RepID=UPI002612135A|nr:VWA domain-containing protein [uncultured Pigmentiphaga sp.]